MVGVAQLVEPRIVIPVVVGSSPIVHPKFAEVLLGSLTSWIHNGLCYPPSGVSFIRLDLCLQSNLALSCMSI